MAKITQKDCIKAIRQAQGEGVLSETEAKELLANMTRKAQARAELKGISIDNAVREIAGEIKASEKTMALIDERNKLLTVLKKRNAKDFVKNFPTWGEGLVAFLRGTTLTRKGAGFGIDQQQMGLRGKYLGRLFAELERDGVLDDFKHGRYGEEFYLESAALSTGKRATDNEAAYKMAKIYHDIRTELTARINRNGGFIEEIPDYILMQTHDIDAIRALGRGAGAYGKDSLKASFDAWNSFTLEKLNQEKTFEGADPKTYMRKVHEALYTGVHGAPADEIEVDGFRAHGSLANKLSSGRVLWFKDAEAAYQYSQKFGTRDFNRAVMGDIQHRARNIALMENLGPNPRNTLDQIVSELQKEARSRDEAAKQVDSLKAPIIQGTYRVLSGEADVSARPTLSGWVDKAKAVTMTAKMGLSMISSFADKPMMQSEMSYQGMKFLHVLGQQLVGMFNRSTEREQMLRYMGVVSHSLIGNVGSRYGFEGRTNRKVEGWLNRYFDVNFLNWWTDRNMETAGELMASHLGEHSHLPMEGLPVELSRILTQYDISAKEWDAMRGTAWSDDGGKFVTADQFEKINDATIDGLVKDQALTPSAPNRQRMRDQLDSKLRAYMADRINTAVPTPGAAERYIATGGGMQRGTAFGEAARLVMLFKSFPITVMRKVVGREVYGRGFDTVGQWLAHDHQGKFNLAMLVAMTGVAGYVSNVVRDLISGRTPKPLVLDDGTVNVDAWKSALARGGGLGIMGDFLFSEYDREYRTALGAIAGPVFGQADPLFALISKAQKIGGPGVTPESVGLDAYNLAANNAPLLNLFYVRPVFDYFVGWNLKEMLSPGVMQRHERSVRDKNHQDFLISPADVANIPMSEPGEKLRELTR